MLSQTLISICGVFLFWACEHTVVGEGSTGHAVSGSFISAHFLSWC